jgi:GntR family transcriptional regulator
MPDPRDKSNPRRPFAHEAITGALRQDIEAGRLGSGDQLPTELALVERFGVSRYTVRAALQQLARDGLITRRAGHGTFVTPYATDPANVHMTGGDQHIFGLASWPPVDLVEPLHVVEDPEVARRFGAEPDTVLRIAFSRMSAGQRVGYWEVSMPVEFRAQVEPALADFQGSSATIIATLEEATGRLSVRAEQVMSAEPAGKELAALLDVKRTTALLRVERTYYDEHEQPLQHVLVRFVPALFSYRLNILRTPSTPRGRPSGEGGPAPVSP